VGAKLFHADRKTDGQPDMTKLTAAFATWRMHLKRLGRNQYVGR